MAILKDVENEYGVEFHYHKLREVRVINDGDCVQLVLTVYSWIDKQARIDGKQPCARQCIINGADFALNPFYALLKAKFSEFTNGENDFDDAFKGNRKPVEPEFFDQTPQGKLFKAWKEATEAPDTADAGESVSEPAVETVEENAEQIEVPAETPEVTEADAEETTAEEPAKEEVNEKPQDDAEGEE